MSFGPKPWLQESWDWRAAGNFIFGGTGAGLLVSVALAPPGPQVHFAATLGGAALVAAGLACVWLEIGRPLRALNVYVNPFTSWMTREAFAALALFACAMASLLLGGRVPALAAGFAALVFVWCQGRILRAAKGIPAWREPLVVPLVVATGLAEGSGVRLVLDAAAQTLGLAALALLALLVVVRAGLWGVYRARAGRRIPRPAGRALARIAPWLLWGGTALVLVLLVLAAATVPGLPGVGAAIGGGLAALAAGWTLKFTLVTRASFNQGFAIPHSPVRGVRPS